MKLVIETKKKFSECVDILVYLLCGIARCEIILASYETPHMSLCVISWKFPVN